MHTLHYGMIRWENGVDHFIGEGIDVVIDRCPSRVSELDWKKGLLIGDVGGCEEGTWFGEGLGVDGNLWNLYRYHVK